MIFNPHFHTLGRLVLVQSIAESKNSIKMPTDITDVAAGTIHDPALALPPDTKHRLGSNAHEVELPPVYEGKPTLATDIIGEDFPTEEELATLRRTAGKIPWKVYTIAFVELCERFSWYGTTVVCES